jgi:hypothetical protein
LDVSPLLSIAFSESHLFPAMVAVLVFIQLRRAVSKATRTCLPLRKAASLLQVFFQLCSFEEVCWIFEPFNSNLQANKNEYICVLLHLYQLETGR